MRSFDRCTAVVALVASLATGCGTAATSEGVAGAVHDAGPAPDGGPRDGGDAPTDAAVDASHGGGLLVGYYAEWKKSAFPPSAVQWSALTHLVEAFVLPEADGGVANAATFADDALVQAAHAHGVKIVASVGGASGDFYRSVVASGPRARTVAALASMCASHGYDGLDIDWEFPDTSTISAWVTLLVELRAALDAIGPGFSLSTTIAPTPPNSDLLPVASLNDLDWVSIMAYRYSSQTSDEVGFLSPLADPDAGEGSVSETIRHLVDDRGVAPSKLLLGLPFYGLEFEDGPPGTPISSPSKVLELDDATILPMVGSSGWTRSWNDVASAPALTDGKLFITYEDTDSIDAKCAFAHARGLGGGMVWHMRQGVLPDGTQPLLAHAAGCR